MNKTTTMRHVLLLLVTFFLCPSLFAQAYKITVKGKVTYEDGYEAIGTSVAEKGNPSNGTTADIDGNYSINVPSNATLTFSMVGCKTQDILVNERTEINIKLEDASYGITDDPIYYVYTTEMLNRDISTSKTFYAAMDKLGRPNSEESLLQGNLSGVYLNPSERANESNTYIRGGNSAIDGRVRYVVNGIPDAPFDPSATRNAFATKDVSSSSVFGTAAASGGVIHVSTTEYLPIIAVNTWMGIQKVCHLLPGKDKDLFEDHLQTGFVQHYDISLARSYEKSRFSITTSFDNVEGSIKSTRAENLTTTLKGGTNLFPWLSADQYIYYRHSKESFPTLIKDHYDIPRVSITKYKPEETIYSATSLESKATDWLKLKTTFTYKKTDNEYSYNDGNPYYTIFRRILWDNTATFDKQWDYHRLRALAGYTYNKREFKFPGNEGYNGDLITNDVLLRAAYNYRDATRSLTAVVRRSSTSENIEKGYAYFPSVSATWNISNEEFAYDLYNILRVLRLRASGGKIGSIGYDSWNEDPERYNYYTAILPPSNLKWQTTNQWNVGLDLFFNDTPLEINVNYFDKRTNNILQISSYGETWDYAKINNRGWEFETSYNFYINRYDHYFALKANMTLYNSSVDKNEDFFLPAGEYLAPDNFYGFGVTYSWEKLRVSALLQGATNAKFKTRTYPQSYIESDYITLKSLNISLYDISLFKIMNSSSARAEFYVNAENLLTNLSSDINSEVSGYYNYPLCRMFSFGARLHF